MTALQMLAMLRYRHGLRLSLFSARRTGTLRFQINRYMPPARSGNDISYRF
jgi:hypothetical protein